MRVLVTGGAGFIGSHTVVTLIEAGHEAVVVDNLSNAKASVLKRIEAITGVEPEFHHLDVRDGLIGDVVAAGFDACIHFAALKAVGQSVSEPLLYYDNNVGGTINLIEALAQTGVRTFIFSSSATVYGDPPTLPVTEEMPIGVATNPYGWTKIMMERMLADLQTADTTWSICLLRYFNPVGAHSNGLIGEDPQGTPSNLMPYISRVAAGLLPSLEVFGGDYPTPDGTGIRDYVHVMDVALGHVAALERLAGNAGVHVMNLGTGRGHSVLEVVRAFEEATGKPVPYQIVGRRPGDVAASWADVGRAKAQLGWVASRGLDQMCADAWRWQTRSS